MSLEVKLCGASSLFDLRIAQKVGADAVGIICRPRTHYTAERASNTVGIDLATQLVEAGPEDMTKVLLPRATIDPEKIINMVDAVRPDRIQLGESSGPRLSERLREHYGDRIEIAQVLHVGGFAKEEEVDKFLPSVDMMVLDTFGPRPGGNGVPHDWEFSRRVVDRVHVDGKIVTLAGGLSAENVALAIRTVRPDGVDSESGINGGFGRYSQIRALRFVQNARGEV